MFLLRYFLSVLMVGLPVAARAGDGTITGAAAADDISGILEKFGVDQTRAEVVSGTIAGGKAIRIIIRKREKSIEGQQNLLRQYREIGLNQTQLQSLKQGDLVVFYDEDLEELRKIDETFVRPGRTEPLHFKYTDNMGMKWKFVGEAKFIDEGPFGLGAEVRFPASAAEHPAIPRRLPPLAGESVRAPGLLEFRLGEEASAMWRLHVFRFFWGAARKAIGPIVVVSLVWSFWPVIHQEWKSYWSGPDETIRSYPGPSTIVPPAGDLLAPDGTSQIGAHHDEASGVSSARSDVAETTALINKVDEIYASGGEARYFDSFIPGGFIPGGYILAGPPDLPDAPGWASATYRLDDKLALTDANNLWLHVLSSPAIQAGHP